MILLDKRMAFFRHLLDWSEKTCLHR